MAMNMKHMLAEGSLASRPIQKATHHCQHQCQLKRQCHSGTPDAMCAILHLCGESENGSSRPYSQGHCMHMHTVKAWPNKGQHLVLTG
jgi:hypothetical protein